MSERRRWEANVEWKVKFEWFLWPEQSGFNQTLPLEVTTPFSSPVFCSLTLLHTNPEMIALSLMEGFVSSTFG